MLQEESSTSGDVLRGFAFKNSRAERYDELFDGQIRRLIVGRHLLTSRESFRTALYRAAARRGIRVRTQFDGPDSIVIQAYDFPSSESHPQRVIARR